MLIEYLVSKHLGPRWSAVVSATGSAGRSSSVLPRKANNPPR